MPNIVSFDKMQVGQKGKGKHWTNQQVTNRKNAAQKMTRKTKVKLKMPVWLDEAAKKIWKRTIKELSAFEILDNVDADALATYCDAVSKYQDLNSKIQEHGYTTTSDNGTESVSPYVKAAQSYARIIMQYADKLGLNPNSRARLAKRIEEKQDKTPLEAKGFGHV